MPDPVDITGQRFGHLTALKFVSRNRHRQARWQCRCDCGRPAIAYAHDLASGQIHSCTWCREIEENERAKERDAKRPVIIVPPLPTEAQIQRMLQRAKERDAARQQELEQIRAAVRQGKPLPVPRIRK